MKVKELIRLRLKHDPDVSVETEGCDCLGIPFGVVTLEEYYSKGIYAETYKGNRAVIIIRGEELCERKF